MKLDMSGKLLPLDSKTQEASHTTQGRSVDVNPKGDKIAVGMRDGSLRVYAFSGKDLKLTYMS